MKVKLIYITLLAYFCFFLLSVHAQENEILFASKNDDGTKDYIKVLIDENSNEELFFKKANQDKWKKLLILRQIDNIIFIKFPSSVQEHQIKMQYINDKATLRLYYSDNIVQFFELESMKDMLETDNSSEFAEESTEEEDIYEIYEGNIGPHKITMYLGDSKTSGTGRFWSRTGFYYYHNQNDTDKKINLQMEGYTGNALGEGGYTIIHELNYLGNVQAEFKISIIGDNNLSGTWKSKLDGSSYSFFLQKK